MELEERMIATPVQEHLVVLEPRKPLQETISETYQPLVPAIICATVLVSVAPSLPWLTLQAIHLVSVYENTIKVLSNQQLAIRDNSKPDLVGCLRLRKLGAYIDDLFSRVNQCPMTLKHLHQCQVDLEFAFEFLHANQSSASQQKTRVLKNIDWETQTVRSLLAENQNEAEQRVNPTPIWSDWDEAYLAPPSQIKTPKVQPQPIISSFSPTVKSVSTTPPEANQEGEDRISSPNTSRGSPVAITEHGISLKPLSRVPSHNSTDSQHTADTFNVARDLEILIKGIKGDVALTIEDSDALDGPSRPTTPEADNVYVQSNEGEQGDSPPDFPPFNIWNIPGARIPPESHKEMTLACRFVPTDQWLTTRVDRAWSVAQVKFHMLTKVWGGRRYQLSPPRNITHPKRSLSNDTTSARMSISSSNYSSVVFASTDGEFSKSSYTLDSAPNASIPSLAQPIPPDMFSDSGRNATPRLVAKSLSSENLRERGRSVSANGSHRRGLSAGGEKRPSSRPSESMMGDLSREEGMDRLYERMESSVKRKVLRAARHYVLVSFSNGHILDEKDPISAYGIKPFELLEIQSATQTIRLPRPTYLEPYFESDMAVQVREGSEKHGIEWIKQLRQKEKEEKVKVELQQTMAALGMDERNMGVWSSGLSTVTHMTTAEEWREEEKKKRTVLEQAQREAEKKAKRERKEAEAEKWNYRKMIVEGHDLNIWKDPVHDTFPEQSWDLRRVVEVQIPRPQSPTELSAAQSAYAALPLSSNLQSSVSTRPPEKKQSRKQREESRKLDQPRVHIRFSIPLSSVYASLNPAGAAAHHAARLKQAAKQNPGSAYLAESLASWGTSMTRVDSIDPYNQSIGFGTSTLEGAGTASLVLRLPDEQAREHLCRIIHRSAGKYPLQIKQRRKLAFEPVVDLTPVPDPDPERKKAHGAPFPEWRVRILKKAIAAGRSGFLSSPAWSAQMNEATGLYSSPSRLSLSSEKGKGSSMSYASNEGSHDYDEDEDEDEYLASDTEWEGWRRELEMEPPPKPMATLQLGADVKLPPTQENLPPTLPAGVTPSTPVKSVKMEDEGHPLTPVQRIPHKLARKGSLKLSKKFVVDGIAGKGLIMPRINVNASWTSFESGDSIHSSFQSHEEYQPGERSNTTANRKPRPTPLVTGATLPGASSAGVGGGLLRAKSATVFSTQKSAQVSAISDSGPLSATHSQETLWATSSPDHKPMRSTDHSSTYLGELPPLDNTALPGLGGGLGNPAIFPRFADRGTTVTTVVSGKQAKKTMNKSMSGSLRGVSWLSKSFGKIPEDKSDTMSDDDEGQRTSTSNVTGLVRGISKWDR